MTVEKLTSDEIANLTTSKYTYVGDGDVPYVLLMPTIQSSLRPQSDGRVTELDKLGIRFLTADSFETNGYKKQSLSHQHMAGWQPRDHAGAGNSYCC